MRRFYRLCAATLVFFLVSQSAHAAIITYANRTAWEADMALSTATLIRENFDGFATGNQGPTLNAAWGVANSELDNLYIDTSVAFPTMNQWALGAARATVIPSFSGQNTSGLGFDYAGLPFLEITTQYGTQIIDVPLWTDPTRDFFGIRGDAGEVIESFRVAGRVGIARFEDFDIGFVTAATAVPEPGSLALLSLIGVGGIGYRRRKSKI